MFRLLYTLQMLLIFCIANCENDYTSELNDYVSQETFENDENNEVITRNERTNEIVLLPENINGDKIINKSLSNESTVNITTEFNKCNYQDNIEEGSDEYSTLINYPFSVSIQRKGSHYTTGALVNKRWILSVAREFYNVRESIKLFRARLGSVDCKRGGTVLPFKSVQIHPSYIYGKPNFDLALLRLGEPVNLTNFIKPIKLSKIRADVINAKFMTTYWPRIVVDGKVLPESAKERIKYNSMRVSTQRMISLPECKKIMKRLNESLAGSSICLKPVKTHHSVCLPDSGAPVMAEDGLWGITSGWISSECPVKPGPTIFTRISSGLVRSWLEANLFDRG